MRTRKIIIYPLIMAFLVPLTVSATETVGTEAVEIREEGVQEEHNEPDNTGNTQPESGNVPQPDAGIEEPKNEPPAENAPPETIPEVEVSTMPVEETIMESTSAEIESESQTETETQTETQTESEPETETETETGKPVLDEEVTGLLKEYLSGAVSGNDAPEETSAEPENTEYQDYVKEALQVLQDNSTTQINLLIVVMAAVALTAGLLIGFLIMRRFL